MTRACGTISAEHRRKVGEGVAAAWKRRKAEGWVSKHPDSPSAKFAKIAAILGHSDPVWCVEYLERSHREICARLQECVQKHRLGLGGERIDLLVCEELDRLKKLFPHA